MGKILYATGIIQGGTTEVEASMSKGIAVKVVQSVSECFLELEENSSEYSFCLICVKSFYNTDGKTEDELFSDLQLIITQNKHIQFCFIDQDSGMRPRFNMSLAPLKNIKYTTTTKISLRIFNTILEKFLEGTNKPKAVETKPISVEIQRPVQKPVTKKEPVPPIAERTADTPVIQQRADEILKTSFTEEVYAFLEDAVVEKTALTMPVEKQPEVEEELIAEDTMKKIYGEEMVEPLVVKPEKRGILSFVTKNTKPKTEPKEKQKEEPKAQTAPQPVVEKRQKKEVMVVERKKPTSKRNPLKTLEGKSLLFTQVSTCGATTVALMVAKIIAKTGLTVCYVEATTGYATSNAIVDTDFYPVTGNNQANNLDTFISDRLDNVADCFEVCEDIHILRNNSLQPLVERDMKMLGNQLPRMFDVVVYDISIDLLRENLLFLLQCSYKYLVLSNDYSDIMKLAIELTRQQDAYYAEDSTDILCQSICKEFRIVVSRYAELDKKSRRKIYWRDIQEEIVNTNEELRDIEMSEISAIVPESISVSQNLFSVDSLKHVTQILEGLI